MNDLERTDLPAHHLGKDTLDSFRDVEKCLPKLAEGGTIIDRPVIGERPMSLLRSLLS